MLVDVGYLSTEVMTVEGDALIFHKVLPVGGAHITLDLVTGLEAPMAQCEQIKRGYVFNTSGEDKQEATEGGEAFTHEQVARVLEEYAPAGSVILVNGSNSMKMVDVYQTIL